MSPDRPFLHDDGGKELPPKITDVVDHLKFNLGQRLTALISGVKNIQLVNQWATGEQLPTSEYEYRLRLAYQITEEMLDSSQKQTPETIRSWFTGTDPFLEDKAPALEIADAKMDDQKKADRILNAARAFLVE